MQKRRPILLNIIILCAIILGLTGNTSLSVTAQEPEVTFSPEVEAIFQRLSPAERVGQLFMVTYAGTDTADESYIAQLIRDYRVGGVYLQPSNKPTVTDGNDPRLAIQTVVNHLQSFAYQPRQTVVITSTVVTESQPVVTPTAALSATATLAPTEAVTSTEVVTQTVKTPTTSVPLFIAVDHEGDGYPYTLLSPELPDVPSGMALGATWNPDYATQVGTIVGQELAALGVNMLFGPVLDVVDKPNLETTGVAGVRAFGSDPYWVGKMGRAYIKGIHTGSQNAVLTIAKHFPGAGGIDRQLNQDIPTIQKLLGQLQLVEMAPFFAVTAIDSAAAAEITDGLMTAHIRYRGLQGNIRDLTKPISLDPQNLPQILASLAPWRTTGGLIVSGPLGVPAVTKTYKATEQTFPARRIALDAFLAGSDVLLLDNFGAAKDNQTQFNHIITAIEFFQDKYETDPVFQQRVDTSVRRIIQAKLKIYKNFNSPQVMRTPKNMDDLPETPDTLLDIVKNGITLIYPDPNELADRIPSPPLPDERILIFTDDRQARLCDTCADFYVIAPDALQNAILNRYGPDASDQINPGQIASYTFTELANALSKNPKTLNKNQEISLQLNRADWIVFNMLDVDETRYPSSIAVKQFLRESAIDLRDKKIIVLAFDAPYYLDNTEVSILTAYYGIYNKTPEHIEAAARLLFKEFSPQGHAPVNIDAVEYKIPDMLEPDPEQVIILDYQKELAENATPEPSPTVTTEPVGEGTPQPVEVSIEAGDRLLIYTGVILDKLGNPVPDNTLVSFNRSYPKEGLELAPLIVPTINGVAQTVITVDREGTMEITAASGDATRSGKIVIEGPTITIETPIPTETPVPTPTPLPTPTATATLPPTPSPTDTPVAAVPTVISGAASPPQPASLVFTDLYLSVLVLIVVGVMIVRLFTPVGIPLEARLWPALVAAALGLTGYVLYGIFAIQLSQVEILGGWVRYNTQWHWLTPLVTMIFALMGLVGVLLAKRIKQLYKESKQKDQPL